MSEEKSKIPIWRIKYKQKFDWAKFIIYFFIGAFLGAALAFMPFRDHGPNNSITWIYYDKTIYYSIVSGSAIICGLLVGFMSTKLKDD